MTDLRDPPQGACALVTGSSRGIGAEVARELAAEGWLVGVNFRTDSEGGAKVVSEIEAGGGRALACQGDVCDPETVDRIFSQLEETSGPVLALVNNAGSRADRLLVELEEEDWASVIDTNLSAVYRTTKRALMPMIRARFGRIVNVTSVVGLRGNPGQANYAAAKAGLIAFTQSVAAEIANRNVTVNAIAPGLVRTTLTEDVDDDILRAIPANRAGTSAEVAACVKFLVSPQASYVTGATLVVDGGLSVGVDRNRRSRRGG